MLGHTLGYAVEMKIRYHCGKAGEDGKGKISVTCSAFATLTHELVEAVVDHGPGALTAGFDFYKIGSSILGSVALDRVWDTGENIYLGVAKGLIGGYVGGAIYDGAIDLMGYNDSNDFD